MGQPLSSCAPIVGDVCEESPETTVIQEIAEEAEEEGLETNIEELPQPDNFGLDTDAAGHQIAIRPGCQINICDGTNVSLNDVLSSPSASEPLKNAIRYHTPFPSDAEEQLDE